MYMRFKLKKALSVYGYETKPFRMVTMALAELTIEM